MLILYSSSLAGLLKRHGKNCACSSQLAVEMWMLLATYAFYRLYHVRNPDIPPKDFHTLLIVLKTVPDKGL